MKDEEGWYKEWGEREREICWPEECHYGGEEHIEGQEEKGEEMGRNEAKSKKETMGEGRYEERQGE